MQLKTASAIIIIGNLPWSASAQLRAHTHHSRELGTDCSQNEALVRKYGRQLCPHEIQDKFTNSSEAPAFSGLLDLVPRFKGFAVNTEDYSPEELSWEEVQSVCVTECDKSPNCDLVSLYSTDCSGEDNYRCITYKPSKKPDGYMVDIPESLGVITYTKVGLLAEEIYPPFVPCEVSAIKNTFCLPTGDFTSDFCNDILNEDLSSYILPAFACLAGKAQECIGCLLSDEISIEATPRSVCATDESSVIRNACKSECYDGVEECEGLLQQSLLCVQGSPIEDLGGGRFVGGSITNINGDYTCPAVEVSSSDE